jgi:TPR repeat protein
MRRTALVRVAIFLGTSYTLVACGPRVDSAAARQQLKEAVSYYTGTAGQVDEAKARALFEAAAERKGPLARMWLAHLTTNGLCGVVKDKAKGLGIAREMIDELGDLAEAGDVEAAFLFGAAHDEGLARVQDKAAAAAWYRKAADHGHSMAQVNLGLMYQSGVGVPQALAEAARWYRAAAENGDARGQYNLGRMYQDGAGLTKDDLEAVRWYRQAAERGLPSSQASLGLMYQHGFGVSKDAGEAARWFRTAAEQGDPLGQVKLGWIYLNGTGVARDPGAAASWCRKAAEHGLAEGQMCLAWMYEGGVGVPKDAAEAARWTRKAAVQGNEAACIYLAEMYRSGTGVPEDEAEAARWYWKVAERGEESWLLTLAFMYGDGEGVVNNDKISYALFDLVTSRGLDWSLARDNTALSLTAAELAEAQTLATSWHRALEQDGRFDSSTVPGGDEERREQGPGIEGTGFFVGERGLIVSNAHVVSGCASVKIRHAGAEHSADVQARDEANDLAVLRANIDGAHGASLRQGAAIRLGDEVVVVGFPLGGVLSSEGGLTTGVVSALAGPGDDSRLFQMTAPVQPGNSGGPVLDRSGNLVGIATAKLDAGIMAAATGDIPDNVAFAIRAELLQTFLNSRGIEFDTSTSRRMMDVADIAEQAKAFTVRVQCLP